MELNTKITNIWDVGTSISQQPDALISRVDDVMSTKKRLLQNTGSYLSGYIHLHNYMVLQHRTLLYELYKLLHTLQNPESVESVASTSTVYMTIAGMLEILKFHVNCLIHSKGAHTCKQRASFYNIRVYFLPEHGHNIAGT
jgi:hypothetical protein